MKRMLLLVCLLLLFKLAGNVQAMDVKDYERKYSTNSFFGLGLRGDSLSGEFDLGTGTGLSLFGGYRFNEILSVGVHFLAPSSHSTGKNILFLTDGRTIKYFTELDLAAFLIDLKCHARTEGISDPYFTLGLGSYNLMDGDDGFIGFGYMAGAGYDFTYPRWLIDLGIRMHFVNYDAAALNEQRSGLASPFKENTFSIIGNVGYRF